MCLFCTTVAAHTEPHGNKHHGNRNAKVDFQMNGEPVRRACLKGCLRATGASGLLCKRVVSATVDCRSHAGGSTATMGEARSVDHSSSPVSTSCLASLCPAMDMPGSTPADAWRLPSETLNQQARTHKIGCSCCCASN